MNSGVLNSTHLIPYITGIFEFAGLMGPLQANSYAACDSRSTPQSLFSNKIESLTNLFFKYYFNLKSRTQKFKKLHTQTFSSGVKPV